MRSLKPLIAPIFVPATRPERILKAAQSGADAVIIDFEDAVPASEKESARQGLAEWLGDIPVPVIIRINAIDTKWFEQDVRFARMAHVSGVMLPKTEQAADLGQIGDDLDVVGLVESAKGIVNLPDICKASNLCQLAFGSIDYAFDVGCVEARDALLLARLSLVTQSRAYNLPPPVDGVTVSVNDHDLIRSDADYAVKLGFGGKLVIHPNQIDIVNAAMRPSYEEIAWAQTICAADKASGGAAVLIDGQMIDAPVIKKARRLLERGKPSQS
jgi:citrate lyase subunit beta/citryl-CoA lyase